MEEQVEYEIQSRSSKRGQFDGPSLEVSKKLHRQAHAVYPR